MPVPKPGVVQDEVRAPFVRLLKPSSICFNEVGDAFVTDTGSDAVVRLAGAATHVDTYDPLGRPVMLPDEKPSPEKFDPEKLNEAIEYQHLPDTSVIAFEADIIDDNVYARRQVLQNQLKRANKGELDLQESGLTPQAALEVCTDFCTAVPECVAVEVHDFRNFRRKTIKV